MGRIGRSGVTDPAVSVRIAFAQVDALPGPGAFLRAPEQAHPRLGVSSTVAADTGPAGMAVWSRPRRKV